MNEEDICRVCRSEGTTEQPLHHPCKCSGSIKHIHQECLEQWLKHSGTQECELCHHNFIIKPVYSPNMPSQIPLRVLLLHGFRFILKGTTSAARHLFVSGVWFALIPYLTSFFWTLNFGPRKWYAQRNNNLADADPLSVMESSVDDGSLLGKHDHFHLQLLAFDLIEGAVLCLLVLFSVVMFSSFQDFINIHYSAHVINEPSAMTNNDMALLLERDVSEFDDDDTSVDDEEHEVEISPKNTSDGLKQLSSNRAYRLSALTRDSVDSLDFDPGFSVGENYSRSSSVGNLAQSSSEFRAAAFVSPEIRAHESVGDLEHYHRSTYSGIHDDAHGDANETAVVNRSDMEEHSNVVREDQRDPALVLEQIPEQAINPPDDVPQPANEDLLLEAEGMNIAELLGYRGNVINAVTNGLWVVLFIAVTISVFLFVPWVVGLCLLYSVNYFGAKCCHLVETYLSLHICRADQGIFFWPNNDALILTTLFNNLPVVSLGYFCQMLIISAYFFRFAQHNRTITGVDEDNRSEHPYEVQWRRGVNLTFLALKVVFMLIVELVLFPLCCGFLVDLSLLPLFHGIGAPFEKDDIVDGKSLPSFIQNFVHSESIVNLIVAPFLHPLAYGIIHRMRFHFNAPISSWFLHWFAGSLFMYHFANFIGMVRSFLRPGVMWFIRDLNEEEFSPIKDIIEKPLATIFEKIMISFYIYASAICLLIGSITYGSLAFNWYLLLCYRRRLDLGVGQTGALLMPLKWSFEGPMLLSLELLIFNLLAPLCFRRLNLKRVYLKWSTIAFIAVARKLRLMSFLFGGRWVSDEDGIKLHSSTFPNQSSKYSEIDFMNEGSFCRVLAQDNVSHDETLRLILVIDQPRHRSALTEKCPVYIELMAPSLRTRNNLMVEKLTGRALRRKGARATSSFEGWKDPFLSPVTNAEFRKLTDVIYGPEDKDILMLDGWSYNVEPLDLLAKRPNPPSATIQARLIFGTGSVRFFSDLPLSKLMKANIGTSLKCTVVFRPPQLRRRIFSFIAGYLGVLAATHTAVIFGSIVLGRQIMKILNHQFENDVYSFLTGFLVFGTFLQSILLMFDKWTKFESRNERRRLITSVLKVQLRRLIFAQRDESVTENHLVLSFDRCFEEYKNSLKTQNLGEPSTATRCVEMLTSAVDSINVSLHTHNLRDEKNAERFVSRLVNRIMEEDNIWRRFIDLPSFSLFVTSATKMLYVCLTCGILLPFLLGAIVETIFAFPIRYIFLSISYQKNAKIADMDVTDELLPPIINSLSLIEDYSAGIIFCSFLWTLSNLLRQLRVNNMFVNRMNIIKRALVQVFQGEDPSIGEFNETCIPTVVFSVIYLLFPFICGPCLPDTFSSYIGLVYNVTHLFFFMMVTSVVMIFSLKSDFIAMIDRIRQDEYQVGTVLHDFDG